MTTDYHSDPAQFRGRGTVWLSFIADPEPHWSGYWDLSPDGPTTALEDSGRFKSVSKAVKWATSRTRRVFLRLDETDSYYWAGLGEPPQDADLEFEGALYLWHLDSELTVVGDLPEGYVQPIVFSSRSIPESENSA